ncbi:hypothetical protein BDF14DRAFT_1912212 [Spinellus fusiger]|nr:hypothetical protein BDF14DRAFT_1912212 [Spinellus fusiger]
MQKSSHVGVWQLQRVSVFIQLSILSTPSHVFLGVAYTNLNQDAEAEASYKDAIEINNTQPLAWHGLLSFYEKRERHKDVVSTIQQLLPQAVKNRDGQKIAKYLGKLLVIYESKEKNDDKHIEVLKYFLPDSQYYDFIKDSSNIPQPIDIWTKLIANIEEEEAGVIESRLQARRFTMNSAPLNQLKSEIEIDVYKKSKLGDMYQSLLDLDPDNKEEVQTKLLSFYRKRLIGLLKKSELSAKMMALANALVEANASDSLPYEMIIEMSDVKTPDQYNETILNTLCERFPNSGTAKLFQGYHLYKQGEVDEAFDLFSEGLELSPDSLYGYQCLSWIYLDAKEFETGLEYAKQGRELVQKVTKETGEQFKNVLFSMELCMAHCYRHLNIKYHTDAMVLYKKILDCVPNTGVGLILCTNKKYDEALEYFEKVYSYDPTRHVALAEIGWIYCQKQDFDKAIQYIESAIKMEDNVAEYAYRLGRVYWNMGDSYRQNQSYAYKYFIQAVKIDPQFSAGFAYLGHYYRTIQQDHVRAKKCYEKAYMLDPLDAEITLPLSDYYVQDNNHEKAESVFRQITNLLPKTGWAWRRLGYTSMKNDAYSEAITCFQKALRTNANDVQCWEGLAEAYAHEGRYVASLRAFERTTDLDPLSVHAHYQTALVKQKVGMLEEAVAGFLKALSLLEEQSHSSTTEIPILHGLANTYLDLAKQDFQHGFFGRTATGCGLVFQTALRGLKQDVSILCLWKIIGDACVMYRLVPSYIHLCPYVALQQILGLVANPHDRLGFTEDSSSKLIMDFIQLNISQQDNFYLPPKTALDAVYACASFAYKQALVLCRNHQAIAPAYWHDLALNYYWTSENSRLSEEQVELTSMAIRCIRMALKMDPTHSHYWNTYGVITMRESPKLSQHALIKAMDCNTRSAIPWTNYGFLCLSRKDYELANQAFETAHGLDPECITAWVGQAYVASLWGNDAAAIFEHAFESSNGSAIEASYGYADTVFNQLSVTNHLLDGTHLLSPAFALQKLTEQRINDALALNLLGLLLERLHQFARAAEAFAGAILALENQAEDGILEESEQKRRMAKVHGNLGRTLCASGDFEGAIASYQNALMLGESEGSARVYWQLGAGIAHYFEDQLEASLEMFETALNETESDTALRQDVVVLLSKVLWALGGDEQRTVAKEQLFSCIADNSSYLPAIFSLCVMGMLEDDPTLTGAALHELGKVAVSEAFESDKEQWIPWLFSRFHKLQGTQSQAIRSVAKSIHQHPWLALLWRRIAYDLVQETSETRDVTHTMTSSALTMTLGNRSTSADDKAEAYECVARASKEKQALREAQRAIMAAPWRLKSWKILAGSMQQ